VTTFHLTSLVGSATPVEIHPAWDTAFRRVPVSDVHQRTLTGELHSVTFGSYLDMDVPMVMVTSAFRTELNRWWEDQREIVWTENLSSNPKSVTCRIENDTAPIGGVERPRFDLFKGMLFLRESRGTVEPYSGSPLIADDAVFGESDSTFVAV
jgi:hypothetical protein